MENLFLAWKEFRKGKSKKPDVQQVAFNLEDNLFRINQKLKTKNYQHSDYTSFHIQDPKLRHIHKACVKDRIVHHAIFRILYPIFDKSFIFDSYSCRLNKGMHKAVSRLETFCRKLSRNNTRNIFALKCDIKKFFANIDHEILIKILKEYISDKNITWLLKTVIDSFSTSSFSHPLPASPSGRESGISVGLPLGNVTSQLFANIYLNELDQFIKHKLKIRYYLRYCDDFIILSEDKIYLTNLINPINQFLNRALKLNLHPDKIEIRKYHQGFDFLGYVDLPHYRVLRTKTKKRIFRKIGQKCQDLKNNLISKESFNQGLQSYFGVLKHCNGRKIRKKINNLIESYSNA